MGFPTSTLSFVAETKRTRLMEKTAGFDGMGIIDIDRNRITAVS
jgi:hypothetical protein